MSDPTELFAALSEHDTPTICNALEVVRGARLSQGFTRQTMICAWPKLKPICGYARTAQIRAAGPSNQPPDAAKQLRQDYYRNLAAAPGPVITVLQDLDSQPGQGAFWGEVNTHIHHGLGVLGCVTNGSIRDLDVIQPDFQLIAGSVGPSHAHVHVEAINVTVEIFGMIVNPGDVIHADRHGAVVFSVDELAQLPATVDLCIRREEPILRAAKAPGFTVDDLIAAWGEADDVH